MSNDLLVLQKLNKELKIELVHVSELNWNTIGYITSNNNIIGINLGDLKLEEIPKPVSKLLNLQVLFLHNNKIKDIKILQNLINLRVLRIYNNQISDIKPLLKLEFLSNLYIANNKIKDISPLKKLLYLNFVDLGKNEIESIEPIKDFNLPIRWSTKWHYEGINIYQNPIINPPKEIIDQGIDAIRAWFESKNKVNFYQSKIVFIGNPTVGKTTIRKNLINPTYMLSEHESTPALNVEKYTGIKINNKTFTYNLWDFGGQGKYRYIQQFFCSPKSLYLFITEPFHKSFTHTKDENYVGMHYWLNMTKNLGKDSHDKNSPVIYVMNKIDKELKRHQDIIETDKLDIQNSGFTNVKYYVGITCVDISAPQNPTRSDLSKLYKLLKDNIPSDALEIKYSQDWINVIPELDKLRIQGRQYISKSDFINIFKKCNTDKELAPQVIKQNAITWLNVLNTVGEIMYFPKIALLREKVIINPNWLKDAACAVLDYEKAIQSNGKFTCDDFYQIWEKFNPEDYTMLLQIITHGFDFCYEIKIDSLEQYVVPALFNNQRASDLPNFEDSSEGLFVHEVFFKNFYPAGILHRLITKLHENIHRQDSYWKQGVIFELKTDSATLAEVTENWLSNRLTVKIKGNDWYSLYVVIHNVLINILDDLSKKLSISNTDITQSHMLNGVPYDIKKYSHDSNSEVIKKLDILQETGDRVEDKVVDIQEYTYITENKLDSLSDTLSEALLKKLEKKKDVKIDYEELNKIIVSKDKELAEALFLGLTDYMDDLEYKLKKELLEFKQQIENSKSSTSYMNNKLIFKVGLPLAFLSPVKLEYKSELNIENTLARIFKPKREDKTI